MGDLRLKVRNKIYTSGNHIVDTKNNNNAIVVFLGKMSSETLKPYGQITTYNLEGELKWIKKSKLKKKRCALKHYVGIVSG